MNLAARDGRPKIMCNKVEYADNEYPDEDALVEEVDEGSEEEAMEELFYVWELI